MSSDSGGYELSLRLLLGFRVIVDEVHADLAANGHPELRPLHGFVFQAIGRAGGPHGCTAADLGRALGVSKQAAGKHIETLERLGYLCPGRDPGDARRKVHTLTERAHDALTRSERCFARIHARWADRLGAGRLADFENDLRAVTPGDLFRFDTPHWFGS
ncbi:MarR family winged helix-turn-helix transcriptional regulator [Nocardia takedensis]|uniref:MarR family winged helix-turn-helix transcriptional regulator n=1 Tax=Nocardia takedensis TaxID=259390 RepID=UPI0003121987|nr:MarR family winged helix-turn-helix transcriptional regulator [Nocardia takedensis]